MKMRYSDFTKERVYEVHKSIKDYFDIYLVEESFWNIYDTIEHNKVAIPKEIELVVREFIDKYVAKNFLGSEYVDNGHSDIDLTEFEQNASSGQMFDEWCGLRAMYDAIADKYIRPILQDVDEK